MWHLGTDEESHNSIDLTQISVDVRNLPFEDSKVKAALCVCGGLNGLLFFTNVTLLEILHLDKNNPHPLLRCNHAKFSKHVN